jgi:hypothetical protein
MSESENSAAGAEPEKKDEKKDQGEPEGGAATEREPAADSEAATSDSAQSDSATSDFGDSSAAPEKKKKKKKKKKLDEAPADTGPALDADGRERPAFVLDFPRHPELDRVVRAFELGNYAYVREHAPKLTENDYDKPVREAASDLLRRIEPDPLVKVLLAMSVLLLLVITFWAYRTHGN